MDENIGIKYKEKFKGDTGLKCAGLCGNMFRVKCADISTKEFSVYSINNDVTYLSTSATLELLSLFFNVY